MYSKFQPFEIGIMYFPRAPENIVGISYSWIITPGATKLPVIKFTKVDFPGIGEHCGTGAHQHFSLL